MFRNRPVDHYTSGLMAKSKQDRATVLDFGWCGLGHYLWPFWCWPPLAPLDELEYQKEFPCIFEV